MAPLALYYWRYTMGATNEVRMATIKNLFPQGHAVGAAFCNRKEEREKLAHCFQTNEHTVLVAPRRYGKSSLIKQVILDTKIPEKRTDLLPATNILFVNKAIKSCFAELASQISPKTKNAKEKIIQFVQNLHPKLTLNILGQKLEVSSSQSPEQSVMDMLIGLDTLAKKVNKKIVLCFDEFQQIGLLKNHHSIEASIRHAVESSSHVTYIFSGSSRHLLSQMFNSKSRPLYHLCKLMELERIAPREYTAILSERAKRHWKIAVDTKIIEEILNSTKCHPYYVNALCRQLWKLEKMPTRHKVQEAWLNYVKTQTNWISDDMARLTPNQRNVLAALAYLPISEPYGNEFCDRVKMGASSVKKTLFFLIKHDFVYRDKDENYKVLDPAIEAYLLQIKSFDFIE